jgi:hypothetical protein
VVGLGGVPEPAGRVDGVLVAAPDAVPLQHDDLIGAGRAPA